MSSLYIIDPTQKFDGSCLNTMNPETGFVYHYDEMTFEQYKVHKNNPNLIALNWEEFYEQYYKPHLDNMQGPWTEITYEEWNEMLNVLPPCNWHDFAPGLNVFYCMEAYTANLHTHYIRDKVNNKYYSALRPNTISDSELLAQYTALIESQTK